MTAPEKEVIPMDQAKDYWGRAEQDLLDRFAALAGQQEETDSVLLS